MRGGGEITAQILQADYKTKNVGGKKLKGRGAHEGGKRKCPIHCRRHTRRTRRALRKSLKHQKKSMKHKSRKGGAMSYFPVTWDNQLLLDKPGSAKTQSMGAVLMDTKKNQ